MDLQAVGWGGMDWITLAQYRDRWWELVNAVMNLRIPVNAQNFLNSWGAVSFSGRILLHGVTQKTETLWTPTNDPMVDNNEVTGWRMKTHLARGPKIAGDREHIPVSYSEGCMFKLRPEHRLSSPLGDFTQPLHANSKTTSNSIFNTFTFFPQY
jgi:hypothetical protein